MLWWYTLTLSESFFFYLFFFSPLRFITHFVHISPSQILLLLLNLMNLFLFFQSSVRHFFPFIFLMDVLFCHIFPLFFSTCHSSAIHWSFFCSFSVSSGGVSWEGQLIYGPKKGTASHSPVRCAAMPLVCTFFQWV